MDINTILRGMGSSPSKGVGQSDVNNTRKTDGNADTASTATIAAKSETVTLTDTANRLRQAAQPSKAEVNSERVASLRAALADGSYKPNAGIIAARLLAFETALKS
ncbi:MAG: flagellar biosynthesis anti-sigma factor FlgM [Thiotrichales bacterium]|jgi:negative regulator of flagellin synthesis FlgM|nr:flagellar biosynthesis anti-sigma factor FlgM [Thiotrichales bacterium]